MNTFHKNAEVFLLSVFLQKRSSVTRGLSNYIIMLSEKDVFFAEMNKSRTIQV